VSEAQHEKKDFCDLKDSSPFVVVFVGRLRVDMLEVWFSFSELKQIIVSQE
jgi:hypothetical protein